MQLEKPGLEQELMSPIGFTSMILCQRWRRPVKSSYKESTISVNDMPLTRRELLSRLCECHGLAPVSWDPSAPQIRPYNARVSNQKLKAAGYQFIHPETVV